MSRLVDTVQEHPTLLVCNDDWATPRADLPYLLNKYRPLLWATQESKGENYRAQVPDKRYGVRQKMVSAGTQGVSVGWDKEHVKAIQGSGHWGWQFLVDNSGLEPRGVVWQDVCIDNEYDVCIAATHRPPKRYDYLWPEFDRKLTEWWAAREMPVVLGMDSNQHGGPASMIKGNRRWHGHDIDGAVSNVRDDWTCHVLPERSSDHPALLLKSKHIEHFVKRAA